jgi:putative variant cofactor biosynthesis B12-binding/radical SAM domain protein 1
MRVLLIQAVSTIPGGESVYPLGLARLAAVLRKDHDLRGLDLNLAPYPWPEVVDAVLEFQPQAVCISFRNLDPLAGNLVSFVPPLKTLATLLRRWAPRARLVIGGSGFSLFARRLLAEIPELDLGLVGEAEESLPLLLGNLGSPAGIAGVVIGGSAGAAPGDLGPARVPAALPPPDYSLFPPAAYRDRNSYVAFMGVESKRGCPRSCSYCLYPNLQGNHVRLFLPEAVVDELERLGNEQGLDMVHFTDPVLNQPTEHLRAICREIMRRGLSMGWTGFFREDGLTSQDLDLFQRAGLKAIYFSADGANESALKLLNKDLSLEQIKQAAALAAESGVISVYHFLVNLPGETRESAEQTVRLAERILEDHHRAGNPAAMVFNNLRPYPGAPLTARIMTQGLMDSRTDLLYPVYFNPPPFDGLRHQLNALVANPEHLGLLPEAPGRGTPCAS